MPLWLGGARSCLSGLLLGFWESLWGIPADHLPLATFEGG